MFLFLPVQLHNPGSEPWVLCLCPCKQCQFITVMGDYGFASLSHSVPPLFLFLLPPPNQGFLNIPFTLSPFEVLLTFTMTGVLKPFVALLSQSA